MKRVSFYAWGIALIAILMVSVLSVRGDLDKKTSNADRIKVWYEKYKTDEKLLDPYLTSMGEGFKMGVRGEGAHLLGLRQDATPEAASINGFVLGYLYGNELYRSLSGSPSGLRESKP